MSTEPSRDDSDSGSDLGTVNTNQTQQTQQPKNKGFFSIFTNPKTPDMFKNSDKDIENFLKSKILEGIAYFNGEYAKGDDNNKLNRDLVGIEDNNVKNRETKIKEILFNPKQLFNEKLDNDFQSQLIRVLNNSENEDIEKLKTFLVTNRNQLNSQLQNILPSNIETKEVNSIKFFSEGLNVDNLGSYGTDKNTKRLFLNRPNMRQYTVRALRSKNADAVVGGKKKRKSRKGKHSKTKRNNKPNKKKRTRRR